MLSFIVYIIIGEKKLLRTNNLEASGDGGMEEEERRCGKDGKVRAGWRKEDGPKGSEKRGNWLARLGGRLLKKMRQMVMCLYKATLFYALKFSIPS